MNNAPEQLFKFLQKDADIARVRVSGTRGSTPRATGAWMLVSPAATYETIGGGQLEYLAIDAARALLASGATEQCLDVALGPEIGQCCGGRVSLAVERMDETARDDLIQSAAAEQAAWPHVFIFGAGHVGRALAAALSLLPVQVLVVDIRREELELVPAGIPTRLTVVPEEIVRTAPAGSAFVILTHDHAMDFLITSEALARGDASYVGMIGSKTKRAAFVSWHRTTTGVDPDAERLSCPIAANLNRSDKRPAVIGALAAAELISHLFEPNTRSATLATTRKLGKES